MLSLIHKENKMKTSFEITDRKATKDMDTEEIFGIMDKWLKTKRGQRYNELMNEYEKMDTDESWEDFISKQPIPEDL